MELSNGGASGSPGPLTQTSAWVNSQLYIFSELYFFALRRSHYFFSAKCHELLLAD
jgi:hypothetical protein